MAAAAGRSGSQGTDLVRVAGLLRWPGIFASLITQPRLNPAFPVPLLLAHDLPHQFSLAGLVDHLRVSAWLAAGTAWRRFPLTHQQILLQAGILARHSATTIIRAPPAPRTRAAGSGRWGAGALASWGGGQGASARA